MRENLTGVQYDPEQSSILSKTLADTIKDKLKGECGLDVKGEGCRLELPLRAL